jgi:RimJ/RimL family protein N-acetyltransferase
LRPSDAEAVFQACQDPLVQQWTVALPVPYSRNDAESFTTVGAPRGWAEDSLHSWAITEAGADAVLGVISLGNRGAGSAEVGYWLAPGARGRGLATKALREACQFGFRTGRGSIQWQALAGNEASRRVAERIGFRLVGPVPRLINQRGRWKDGWIATLLVGDARMPEPAVLSDGVVRLRGWEGGDLEALPGLVDEAVLTWTGVPGQSRAELAEWLELVRRPQWPPAARCAVTDHAGGLLGQLRISRDRAPDSLDLGWWLGPQARGKGNAYRALRLALAWAAGFGPARFTAGIFDGNTASIALAERLGMRCEGLRRGYWSAAAAGGPRRDTWLYSLVPSDDGWPRGG